MAYEKNTWKSGDVITSTGLNHMEDGIAGAANIMWIENVDNALNKTWQEIHDAVSQHILCVIIQETSGVGGSNLTCKMVSRVSPVLDGYNVETADKIFFTDEPSGYPHADDIS